MDTESAGFAEFYQTARDDCLRGLPSDTPPLPADCTMVAMSDEADANLQGKILGIDRKSVV